MRARRRKITIQLEFNWNDEIQSLDEALCKAQKCLAKGDDFDSLNELSFLRTMLRKYLPNDRKESETNDKSETAEP